MLLLSNRRTPATTASAGGAGGQSRDVAKGQPGSDAEEGESGSGVSDSGIRSEGDAHSGEGDSNEIDTIGEGDVSDKDMGGDDVEAELDTGEGGPLSEICDNGVDDDGDQLVDCDDPECRFYPNCKKRCVPMDCENTAHNNREHWRFIEE